eukprot:TRINITY_DN9852_c0_g1_i1.p1 TRINITY_DN9852_c0_g1~~TRINITY_DN9852_c0_g1_i1.p1  ORF type:complete len:346 (-),score=61.70 TRINITY_DN9852_c0_g1_i1:48-1085(-)
MNFDLELYAQVIEMVGHFGARFRVPENPDLGALSTQQLRRLLAIRGVSAAGCFEKSEIAERLHDDYVQSEVDIGATPVAEFGVDYFVISTALDSVLAMVFKHMADSAGRPPSGRVQKWIRAQCQARQAMAGAVNGDKERKAYNDATFHELTANIELGMIDIGLQRKLCRPGPSVPASTSDRAPTTPSTVGVPHPSFGPAESPPTGCRSTSADHLKFDNERMRSAMPESELESVRKTLADLMKSCEPTPMCIDFYENFEARLQAVPEDPDLSSLSTQQLRQLLAVRGVSVEGCTEKSDLVQRLHDDYVQVCRTNHGAFVRRSRTQSLVVRLLLSVRALKLSKIKST